MPRRRILLFVFLLAAVAATEAWAQPTPSPTRVGVVFDGPGSLNESVLELTRQAVRELTEGEFDLRFDAGAIRTADWSTAGVRGIVGDLLDDPEVDLVLTLGVIGSHLAVEWDPLPKPVIAPFVVNYGAESLPLRDGGSGVRNLSYLVLPRTFRRDVETFVAILDFMPVRKLAVLYSGPLVSALPFLRSHVESVLGELGLQYQSVVVQEDAVAAATRIGDDVDAVLVMPLLHLPAEQVVGVAQLFVQRRLPSFAVLGRGDVEKGLLAALNPDFFPRITRRIGLNVQSILLGERPETLPVAFAAGERLTLNLATANAMDLPLRWATVTEADVVGDAGADPARVITLLEAVRDAVVTNRDLAVAERQLSADAQEVAQARSRLLPEVELGATALLVDEDRAESSFGAQPERSVSASASLRQLLYSDGAWAGLGIEKELQAAREADLRALRMDVMQEAATAYLQVLRAESIEIIQTENMKLTRSNLELAQVREMVGQSGPAEALRLESQLATNVSDAIAANARRNVAEIELNRVLHRPLEEPFRTTERGLEDLLAALEADEITWFLASKRAFATFRDFMGEVAEERAPELAALDHALAAQQRRLGAARRDFFLPDLALRGEVSRLLDESGAGTDPPAGLGASLETDDTEWSLALGLSFPLFRGGVKWAERRQAAAQVGQLQMQKEQLSERIAQRVRSALHVVGASHAAIDQARRASEAADRSLGLVVDAYAQGTVSILDLLDAQTRALVAQEQEAASVFDFFIDLMEVYRAVGAIEAMLDPSERAVFLRRADDYFEARGRVPRP